MAKRHPQRLPKPDPPHPQLVLHTARFQQEPLHDSGLIQLDVGDPGQNDGLVLLAISVDGGIRSPTTAAAAAAFAGLQSKMDMREREKIGSAQDDKGTPVSN